MACLSFFSRLRRSRKRNTETQSTDPTVSPRPQSLQLGLRSSDSTPPPLRRQKSEGKQRRRSFGLNLLLPFHLGATGGITSQIPSTSGHHLPDPNVDESESRNLSSCVVHPTAAHEDKPNWNPTVYASTGLAIDILKESSDAFTPLKSMVGGLSAVLKYYDVRYSCLPNLDTAHF